MFQYPKENMVCNHTFKENYFIITKLLLLISVLNVFHKKLNTFVTHEIWKK